MQKKNWYLLRLFGKNLEIGLQCLLQKTYKIKLGRRSQFPNLVITARVRSRSTTGGGYFHKNLFVNMSNTSTSTGPMSFLGSIPSPSHNSSTGRRSLPGELLIGEGVTPIQSQIEEYPHPAPDRGGGHPTQDWMGVSPLPHLDLYGGTPPLLRLDGGTLLLVPPSKRLDGT